MFLLFGGLHYNQWRMGVASIFPNGRAQTWVYFIFQIVTSCVLIRPVALCNEAYL